jgi:hypothetical protein
VSGGSGDPIAVARFRHRSWGDAWQTPGGIAASQDEIAELDARATRIWEYQSAMVPARGGACGWDGKR